MNGLMPHTTTATELQRNYQKIAKRAKRLSEPIVVLSNNKPKGIYMDFESFKNWQKKQNWNREKGKGSFKDLFGIWTKQEAEEFNKRIDAAFENIDEESWK